MYISSSTGLSIEFKVITHQQLGMKIFILAACLFEEADFTKTWATKANFNVTLTKRCYTLEVTSSTKRPLNAHVVITTRIETLCVRKLLISCLKWLSMLRLVCTKRMLMDIVNIIVMVCFTHGCDWEWWDGMSPPSQSFSSFYFVSLDSSWSVAGSADRPYVWFLTCFMAQSQHGSWEGHAEHSVLNLPTPDLPNLLPGHLDECAIMLNLFLLLEWKYLFLSIVFFYTFILGMSACLSCIILLIVKAGK